MGIPSSLFATFQREIFPYLAYFSGRRRNSKIGSRVCSYGNKVSSVRVDPLLNYIEKACRNEDNRNGLLPEVSFLLAMSASFLQSGFD